MVSSYATLTDPIFSAAEYPHKRTSSSALDVIAYIIVPENANA
jgi:hypothetical protein